MPAQPILIVGGGLAGLTVARRLHQAGRAFLLLEARARLGGRILTVDAAGTPAADGFDLGPSWIWPDMQPAIAGLVDELRLPRFPQFSDGDLVFQVSPREAPRRFPGMRQEPESMRLAGGTGALIAALTADLPHSSLRLGAKVTEIALDDRAVTVGFVDAAGAAQRIAVGHVILALPPRLLAATVRFTPALDPATARLWRETPTWMAPHAKFVAVYDRPFWREAGLSGTAQSRVGPLGEIHDATTASGQAALFGFVGVPADWRAEAGREAVVRASVQQLAHVFGPLAAAPRATLLHDWAADTLTATDDDRTAGEHPMPATRPWVTGAWQGRIILAGSETSDDTPGYLTGAVAAAERAVRAIPAAPAG